MTRTRRSGYDGGAARDALWETVVGEGGIGQIRLRTFRAEDATFADALCEEAGRLDVVHAPASAMDTTSPWFVAERDASPFGLLCLKDDGLVDALFVPQASEADLDGALIALCRVAAQRGLTHLSTRHREELAALFHRAGFQLSDTQDRRRILSIDLTAPVPHNRLTFGDEEAQAAADAVRSGYWAQGPRVKQLEELLVREAGGGHAVCVASGLGALRLALRALGVGPGDAVIVPAYSCVALANAVLAIGAEPIPVDVRADDWNLDPDRVREAVRVRAAKAVIAVNTFGCPADIDALRDAAQAPVIEDCAHAFGGAPGGQALGTRGDLAVLSFYATKLVGAGEGGAVLTRRDDAAEFITQWRDYTNQEPDPTRLNDKMTDIEAAIACCQMQRLPELLAARAALAARYNELLENAARRGLVGLPSRRTGRVWYRYVVELKCDVAPVAAAMATAGVQAVRPVLDWRGAGETASPAADAAYTRLLSLPLYPLLSHWEQTRAADALLDALGDTTGEHASLS